MKRLAFALVVIAGLLAIHAVEAGSQEIKPTWIPLLARVTQRYFDDAGTMMVESTGIYVRDSHGRSYSRVRGTYAAGAPFFGRPDFGILDDRPSHLTYIIDFGRRTFRKEKTDPSEDITEPQTREEFDKARAGEEFLGKQVISGIECEGYQAPAPNYKKHFNETWYAPSLNFLVIRSTRYNPMKQQVKILLHTIRAGTEPSPIFFRLPSSFREVR